MYRADNSDEQDLELPVEELLRLARPLPPHEEMLIVGVTADEGSAFLAAVDCEHHAASRADRHRHRRLRRGPRPWLEAHRAVCTDHRRAPRTHLLPALPNCAARRTGRLLEPSITSGQGLRPPGMHLPGNLRYGAQSKTRGLSAAVGSRRWRRRARERWR